jgi:hypothetical protein
MNAFLTGLARRSRSRRGLPFSGVAAVFLWRMRSRNARRDLLWTGVLLAVLLILAAMLQTKWEQVNLYSGTAPHFLLRWLRIGAASAAFLFLPCAAVLGAGAVPPTAEFETTQAALMTRLTALDICVGRLLAALWPLISTLLASCAFWLAAQLGWRFVEGGLHGFGPILSAHLVLFCAVIMVGAVGFLFATRRRPGRVWGRGAVVALLWVALCLTALFLCNPQIQRMNDPTRLIEGTLLLNPVAAVATAYQWDILRTPWLYDHTDAPEYPFLYPPTLASAGIFMLTGLGALGLAALRLRRAYR